VVEQPVPIVGSPRTCQTWSFRAPGGGEVAFRLGDEYTGASGVQQPSVSIDDAEVVFVGYGIQAPEEGWNDFKGAELAGKVLLMLNDDPDWDPALFGGERKLSYGRWTYKYESAARQGAAAAIIIHTAPSAGYPWQVVRSSWSGEQFELPAGDEPRTLLKAWLTEDAARRLVALAGNDLDGLIESARSPGFAPVALGATTSLLFAVDLHSAATANVGGILRGADPELADELVVISAHHDHFGIGEPDATGDTTQRRARQRRRDGSGVGRGPCLHRPALTAAAQRPRPVPGGRGAGHPRIGLLRAQPSVPSRPDRGRHQPRARQCVGSDPRRDRVRQGQVRARRAARPARRGPGARAGRGAGRARRLVLPLGPDQFRPRRGAGDLVQVRRRPSAGRQAGANAVHRWIEHHYHQPSDEVEPSWNLDGLVQDARLAFLLATTVANRDAMPAWVPGDEFEDERLASLAELR
jgi:hypothetical protein